MIGAILGLFGQLQTVGPRRLCRQVPFTAQGKGIANPVRTLLCAIPFQFTPNIVTDFLCNGLLAMDS